MKKTGILIAAILIYLLGATTLIFIKQKKQEEIAQERYQAITIGAPDAGQGESLYSAFTKVNSNFDAHDDSIAGLRAFIGNLKSGARLLSDYAFMLDDSGYYGGATTRSWVENYVALHGGSGGTISETYELRGTVGTTEGFPTNGDSLIRNSYFDDFSHIILLRDGTEQWWNIGKTNNTGTISDAFCLVDTVIKVRPAFATGEEVVVRANAVDIFTELIAEGGAGAGGDEGGSVLLDSLLCYYKLDETTGTVAYEEVGDYNATIDGTVNQTGKLGRAVYFDGASDDIAIPNNSAIIPTGTTMSISMWVNFTALPSVEARVGDLMALNNTTSPWTTHRLYVDVDDKWNLEFVNNSGNSFYLVYSTGPQASTWYHVVGVLKSTGARELWINGVRVSNTSANFTGTLYPAAGNYALGNRSPSGNTGLKGLIDEVAIYSQALSPADIALLYNSGSGRTYPF